MMNCEKLLFFKFPTLLHELGGHYQSLIRLHGLLISLHGFKTLHILGLEAILTDQQLNRVIQQFVIPSSSEHTHTLFHCIKYCSLPLSPLTADGMAHSATWSTSLSIEQNLHLLLTWLEPPPQAWEIYLLRIRSATRKRCYLSSLTQPSLPSH